MCGIKTQNDRLVLIAFFILYEAIRRDLIDLWYSWDYTNWLYQSYVGFVMQEFLLLLALISFYWNIIESNTQDF